ncbi:MAG TPA: hypothetical protein VJJ52_02045 [Candidatus Nanoarchaeia archaeon]|nr:hypothetical protein [Candidatus Nanoarchaeia archaeon]
MIDIPLFASLVVDILSILALSYVIVILGFAEKKSDVSKLTVKFERLKREKILRNSLMLLALSFVFSSFAFYGALFNACSDKTAEVSRLISKLFLFVFILFTIHTLKYATVKKKAD